MKYITEEGHDSWFAETQISGWLTEFSLEKEDYFLNYRLSWKRISGTFYHFRVGDAVVSIPTGFYVLVTEPFGDLDWVQSDELITRELDLFVSNPELNAWTPVPARFFRQTEETIVWPSSKNIIPMVTGDITVLLSEKDMYNKMNGLTAYNLIV